MNSSVGSERRTNAAEILDTGLIYSTNMPAAFRNAHLSLPLTLFRHLKDFLKSFFVSPNMFWLCFCLCFVFLLTKFGVNRTNRSHSTLPVKVPKGRMKEESGQACERGKKTKTEKESFLPLSAAAVVMWHDRAKSRRKGFVLSSPG